jgi:photosystem II stability/assembly factor-like uncharacterized protein
MTRSRRVVLGGFCGLVVSTALGPMPAFCHDPSAYGGLFRSRDDGATWLPANPGRVVSGAIALAVSSGDPTHLLLATDSGLLRSRNGGLEWSVEAPTVLVGPVFAVVFAADGRRALAATTAGLFRSDDGETWRATNLPARAAPARALVTGPADQVYLAGWTGLHRSWDWGATWETLSLPSGFDGPVSTVLSGPGRVHAIVGGRVLTHEESGAPWSPVNRGLPAGEVEAIGVDPRDPAHLWAASARQLWRSEDAGRSWHAVGRPLPDPTTRTRAIAVASRSGAVTLATDRGLYRSPDAGEHWELLGDILPAHLEAWPLVRDPKDPATLYAGFALTPYLELWRMAAEGSTALSRLDTTSVIGGIAFLALVGLGGGLALRQLARRAGRARV